MSNGICLASVLAGGELGVLCAVPLFVYYFPYSGMVSADILSAGAIAALTPACRVRCWQVKAEDGAAWRAALFSLFACVSVELVCAGQVVARARTFAGLLAVFATVSAPLSPTFALSRPGCAAALLCGATCLAAYPLPAFRCLPATTATFSTLPPLPSHLLWLFSACGDVGRTGFAGTRGWYARTCPVCLLHWRGRTVAVRARTPGSVDVCSTTCTWPARAFVVVMHMLPLHLRSRQAGCLLPSGSVYIDMLRILKLLCYRTTGVVCRSNTTGRQQGCLSFSFSSVPVRMTYSCLSDDCPVSGRGTGGVWRGR